MKSYLYIAAACLLASSCGEQQQNAGKGAIVMGDSATIVTETDSQYLRDVVQDIEWAEAKPQAKQDDKPAPAVEKEIPPAAPTTAKGFTIDCGAYTITIAGIDAKEYKTQNPQTASGLSYALTEGKITNSQLVFSAGVKNLSVKQRYQSQLIMKGNGGEFQLTDLGLYTSGWTTLKDNGTTVAINGLERPGFVSANNNKIVRAADRALRKKKTSSKNIQAWMKDLRKVRKPGDEPTDIVLSNVQWQISGTDSKGKAFTKTLRLDIP